MRLIWHAVSPRAIIACLDTGETKTSHPQGLGSWCFWVRSAPGKNARELLETHRRKTEDSLRYRYRSACSVEILSEFVLRYHAFSRIAARSHPADHSDRLNSCRNRRNGIAARSPKKPRPTITTTATLSVCIGEVVGLRRGSSHQEETVGRSAVRASTRHARSSPTRATRNTVSIVGH